MTRLLKELEVGEISLVDKPAVPGAKFLVWKAKAPEDQAWNLTAAEINDLPDSAFAWIDPEYTSGESDDKSKRKLPHHNKAGQVVWRGVAAAGAVLQGGRGGVDIPSGDVAGVRGHLAGHYKEFDKEPPWTAEKSKGRKVLEFVKGLFLEDASELEEVEKEGRKISSERLRRLKEAVEAMTAGAKAVAEIIAETDLGIQTTKEVEMNEDERKEFEDLKKKVAALETKEPEKVEKEAETEAETEAAPEPRAILAELKEQSEELVKAVKGVNEKIEKHLGETSRASKKTDGGETEKKESVFKGVL